MSSLLFAPAAELADLQHKLWFILIIFTMQSQITKLLRSEVLDQKKKTVQPIFPIPMLYTPGCERFSNWVRSYRENISCPGWFFSAQQQDDLCLIKGIGKKIMVLIDKLQKMMPLRQKTAPSGVIVKEAEATDTLVEVKDLYKVYSTAAGDFTALNGINVAGKTG